MIQLFNLAGAQLSVQIHYDFGMRAVKTVLSLAGSLLRESDQASEEEILIKALRQQNIPKFIDADLPLFEGLIHDLFPLLEIRDSVYEALETEIAAIYSERNLTWNAQVTKKIVQLYEGLKVRNGVMVVGNAMNGKSTMMRTLIEALRRLEVDLLSYVLNPKSLGINYMFGQVNPLTNEWHDGVVSSLVRQNMRDKRLTYVVFDGPVDAIWVENMNTVLDDNRMLCLPNGERIKVYRDLTLMFEVDHLKQANPSTVSRCGMVYCDTTNLSWKQLVESYSSTLVKKLGVELEKKNHLTASYKMFINKF